MNLSELKQEIQKYQYMEDTDIIDISLASILATRLGLGDPVWLILIGASSGGKSQILRPLALTDTKFLHRLDDLTENTFLSGGNVAGGKDVSLLTRIGPKGMLVISDFTVIFSKSPESQAAILSQFRMIYDGEMVKYVGTKAEPLSWKGYLGVLAGSTPTIYSNFEQVSDMGERFIYYRMKDYDPEKATRIAMGRKIYGKELDNVLSELYVEYLKDIVINNAGDEVILSDIIKNRIITIAVLAERIRTTCHTDFREKTMDRLPVSAMPMRVALQLTAIAKGLSIMRKAEGEALGERDLKIIDWCGYSLANEEKRACLRILAELAFDSYMSTQNIADKIGLSTGVIGSILQNLASVGVVARSGSGSLIWKILKRGDWEIIREIEGIVEEVYEIDHRELSEEELKEVEPAQSSLDKF